MKKLKEQKKAQKVAETKEMRLSMEIDNHDLEIKAKQQDDPPAIKYMREKTGEMLGQVNEVTYLEENRGRIAVSYWVERDDRVCECEHEYDFNQFGRDFTTATL